MPQCNLDFLVSNDCTSSLLEFKIAAKVCLLLKNGFFLCSGGTIMRKIIFFREWRNDKQYLKILPNSVENFTKIDGKLNFTKMYLTTQILKLNFTRNCRMCLRLTKTRDLGGVKFQFGLNIILFVKTFLKSIENDFLVQKELFWRNSHFFEKRIKINSKYVSLKNCVEHGL